MRNSSNLCGWHRFIGPGKFPQALDRTFFLYHPKSFVIPHIAEKLGTACALVIPVPMAMALLGKNKHYRWERIVRRHWLETARKCHFDGEEMAKIIGYCCDMVPGAIEKVEKVIPKGFPEYIASSIFSGLSRARDRLIR